jgi:hypothetical protein
MRAGAITSATQPTVYVVGTGFEGTRAALAVAIPLARGSCARLMLLAPQVVPYPLPVDRPVERASREELIARRLTHVGHRVIFAPISERSIESGVT